MSAQELRIIDPAGTTRVIISGDVPEPVINGKVLDRGTNAAGILLFDEDEQERSGYLTFDEGSFVGLTLDSKKEMQALFVAGPDGGTAMTIRENDCKIELRADSSGARMTSSKENKVTAQIPEIKGIPNDVCELFKGGIKIEVPEGLPRNKVKEVCETRYSEQACLPCLPKKSDP